MTFTYAGEYASDVLYRTQGAAGGVSVAVTTSADTPATLYTDATKDTPLASNVVTTDQYGNLTFFADPGTYTCTVGSATFTAVVAVNPLESGGGGSGSVTSVAVESANGLAGTVADSTTTPQITLQTTATGVLKGAGGVIEAATAGTDYLSPSGSGAALTGITAAQVGADASGAAATAQGDAETFATSAVATETSRAETAEALKVPLSDLPLSIPNGGTGATTAATARTALGVPAVQANPAGFTPANPSSTSSTTPVMMGFGATVTYTPAASGLVIVNVTFFTSNTSNDPNTVGVRYGTGTAPSFGAAATGTRFGAVGDTPVLGNGSTPYGGCFAATALLTLAAGTPYWFDAVLTAAGGHASVVENAGFTIFELP